MAKRVAPWSGLAAGATLGGFVVGAGEGLFRGVPFHYAGFLYATLWALGGTAAAVLLGLTFGDRYGDSPRLLKAGPCTWGAAGAVGASALVLVRFIVLRDVMQEAVTGRWKASAAALGAAIVGFAVVWGLGRFLGRRTLLPRPWLWPSIAIIAFAALTFAGDDALPSAPAPRAMKGGGVLFVVVDTLRADMLGAYGASDHNGESASPRIDEFAESARIFTDVSAQASWTKPAVASLVTSRHVSGHDTMSKTAVLPEALPTISTEAQRAGLKTAAVVTNYNLEPNYGFARGFDEFHYLAPARYLGAPAKANRLAAYNVYRLLREKLFTGAREARYFYRTGAQVNAMGFDILDRVGDERFMLWLHYMEPHDPYFATDGASYARVSHPHPEASWADPMRLAYRDDIRRFDTYFGELLDGLEKRGLRDSTTIVLVSDHGEEFGDHGGFYHGVTLYEEQLFVPLIIGGPNLSPGIESQMARQIDVAPTILGRLQLPAPKTWEGRDLFGSSPLARVSIAEEDHEGNVLRSVRYAAGAPRPLKMITANAGNPRGLPEVQLFDLGADPAERAPLGTAGDVVEKLKVALADTQSRAQEGGATAGTKELDADAEAELRSLGYVQ